MHRTVNGDGLCDATKFLPFRPPAAQIQSKWLKPFPLLYWRMINNYIDAWPAEAYEKMALDCGPALANNIILNDPAEIRRVFRDTETYEISAYQRHLCKSLFGGSSIATAGHEEWHSDRQLFNKVLDPNKVSRLSKHLVGWAQEMANAILAETPHPLDQIVSRYSLQVILAIAASWHSEEQVDWIARDLAKVHNSMGMVGIRSFFRILHYLPGSAQGTGVGFVRKLSQALQDEIAARESGKPGEDLLGQYVKLADQDGADVNRPVANALALLSAGYETTANAMAWCLWMLAQSPWLQEAIREELEGILENDVLDESRFRKLTITRAMFREVLRLFPSLPLLARTARRDDQVAGIPIKAGKTVFVSPYIVHRHRKLWRDPDMFDPFRFLSPRSAEMVEGAYIPFGAGARSCPGFPLAYRETVIGIAAVLGRMTLSPTPDEQIRLKSGLALRPDKSLQLQVSARRN